MDKVEIIDRIATNDTEVVRDVVLELLMSAYNHKQSSLDTTEKESKGD